MRSYPVITGLAVGVLALFFCGSAAAATSAPRAAVPHYLFSIPSGSGSLTGPNDRHLTLRLSDARRYLTRFTDRPLRHAAVVANVDFARRFTGYFAGDDPNAVLTYTVRGSKSPSRSCSPSERPAGTANAPLGPFPQPGSARSRTTSPAPRCTFGHR